MRYFIWVTVAGKERQLWLNPKFISSIEPAEFGSRIVMSNSSVFNVKEPPEELMKYVDKD